MNQIRKNKMTVDEQLQMEKKQDIVKILISGLVNLDFFSDKIDISSKQVDTTYLNKNNASSIQIRNFQDVDTEIAVCGMGEGMSHLLSIDTIQKAEDYITVLKKHLTEEPVKNFINELNNMKRKRHDN